MHPSDSVEMPAMYKILSSTPKETDKMKDTFRKNGLVVETWNCKSRLFEKFFKTTFGFLKEAIKKLKVIKSYDTGSFSSRVLNSLYLSIF